jgi:cysteine desulfurase family protein (TIGR01976 family)
MKTLAFPIDAVREAFPALALRDGGEPRIYFDNPAGTQVPRRVAAAAADCLIRTNANLGGAFVTSRQAGAVVDGAHRAMANLLGAGEANEIAIGPSMTALTFRLTRSIAHTLEPGDEIVLSRMDHDANVAPWLRIACERGAAVRFADFDHGSWVIEPAAFERELSARTKIAAFCGASNLTGSINDVAALSALAKARGALVFVDAVQFTPHVFTDVATLGCDFLACSSYKFFGPHLGVLWGRADLLRSLVPYKVRPSSDEIPYRWETGTPQIELDAALAETVAYFEWLGREAGAGGSRRDAIRGAFEASTAWEAALAQRLIDGLQRIAGVAIAGITDPARIGRRVPTVSFRHDRLAPAAVAQALADRNVFVWSGNNYALEVVRSLGIPEDEGVVRIGLAHYNTPAEVDATLEYLARILG